MKSFKCLLLCLLISKMSLSQLNNRDAFFDYRYDKEKIRSRLIDSIIVTATTNGKAGSKAIYNFNEQGCLTQAIYFDSAGIITSKDEFEFNSNKDVVSRKRFDNKFGDYEERFYKKYENNRLTRDSSTFLPAWYEYKYNNNGSLVQTIMHSKFGFDERIVDQYQYNNEKLLIDFSQKRYNINDSAGILLSHRLIRYDEKGRKIREEELVDATGYTMMNKGSVDYGYDSSGNLVKIKWEKTGSRFFEYDHNGLIIAEKVDVDLEADQFDPDDFKAAWIDTYTYRFRK
jgi:hypothetical protein